MSDVELRLERLERSLTRWRRAALACAVGLCCVPLLGQARPSKALVVDHFTVRDHEGKPRLVISRGGRISFRNGEGLEVGSLSEEGIEFTALDDDPADPYARRLSLKAPRKQTPPGLELSSGRDGIYARFGERGPAWVVVRSGPRTPGQPASGAGRDASYGVDTIDLRQDATLVQRLDLRAR